jgi:hypothetical protein
LKKIDKKLLIKSLIIFVFIVFFILIQINFSNEYNINKNSLNLNIPPKIEKNECNITYLGKNKIFVDVKIKKQKKENKKVEKNDVLVEKNKLIFKNKVFIYLGDIKENKNLFALFKYYDGNNTIFYKVKINNFIDHIPVKLKENNYKYLLLEYNSSLLEIKKEYIDIKKFSKDKNETKNH